MGSGTARLPGLCQGPLDNKPLAAGARSASRAAAQLPAGKALLT